MKKRVLGGEGKRRMVTRQKLKAGVMFMDFGEMVEYDILGGILEIYNRDCQPAAFCIQDLILYGSLVVVKNSDYVVTPSLQDFAVQVGEIIERPYRGPRGHLSKYVGFSNTVEADVISEDRSNFLEPTF